MQALEENYGTFGSHFAGTNAYMLVYLREDYTTYNEDHEQDDSDEGGCEAAASAAASATPSSLAEGEEAEYEDVYEEEEEERNRQQGYVRMYNKDVCGCFRFENATGNRGMYGCTRRMCMDGFISMYFIRVCIHTCINIYTLFISIRTFICKQLHPCTHVYTPRADPSYVCIVYAGGCGRCGSPSPTHSNRDSRWKKKSFKRFVDISFTVYTLVCLRNEVRMYSTCIIAYVRVR